MSSFEHETSIDTMNNSDNTLESDKLLWIFDLDGTILDNIPIITSFFTIKVPEHFGKERIDESTQKQMKTRVGKLIGNQKSHKIFLLKVLMWFGKRIGLSIRERFKMLSFIKENLNIELLKTSFFPGTVEALKFLHERGDLLAINTTSTRNHINRMFSEETGKKEVFDSYINFSVASDEIKRTKPNPESIHKILIEAKKFGITEKNTIMVGDMPGDINAGKNAHTYTIAVLGGFFTRDMFEIMPPNEHPDFIFKDVAEAIHHYDEIKSKI